MGEDGLRKHSIGKIKKEITVLDEVELHEVKDNVVVLMMYDKRKSGAGNEEDWVLDKR